MDKIEIKHSVLKHLDVFAVQMRSGHLYVDSFTEQSEHLIDRILTEQQSEYVIQKDQNGVVVLRAILQAKLNNLYDRDVTSKDYHLTENLVDMFRQLFILKLQRERARIDAGRPGCPKCSDRGWLFDDDGQRLGICPCHLPQTDEA